MNKLILFCLLAFALCLPAVAQQYTINWHKIGGGGLSAGGTYQVNDTIGQPDASGVQSGGNYTLIGGFWSFLTAPQPHGTPNGLVWTNTAGGNWNTAANWSPNRVPGASDTVLMTTPGSYTVSVTDNESVSNLVLGVASGTLTLNILGGTFTVNGTGSDSTQSALVMSGGTVNGTGSIVVGGPLTWTGGNIYGILSANGGRINVTAGSSVSSGGQLINTGPLTWTPNSGPRTGNGTIISNAPSGVISVALNGNNIDSFVYGGTAAFYNAGTINVSGAGQSGFITDPFFNSGTVNVNSGTLSLTAGGINSGTINAASGADLDFSGGTFTSTAGSLMAGAGNLSDSGGGGTYNFAGPLNLGGSWTFGSGATVNLTGSTTVSGNTLNLTGGGTVNFNGTGKGGSWQPGAVNLSNGTLGGTTPVVTGGPLTWTGGNIYGIVSANGGRINVTAGSSVSSGGQLINTGPLTWTPNSGPRTGNGTIISNAPSGVISVALNGNNIDSFVYGGTAAFYNAGTINVSGAGQSGFITDPFFNTGTVNVNSGTLNLTGEDSLTNGALNFGITSASAYGKLALAGPAALTGTLGVTFNGYTPVVSDAFGLITYGSESGAFTAFNLPGTVGWQKTYGATLFTLTVSSLVSGLPNLTIANSGNSVMVSWPDTGGYTLQTNNDLSTPSWFGYGGSITTANGTNSVTLTPPTGKLFFRLQR